MTATAIDSPTWISFERIERRWALSPIPAAVIGVWGVVIAVLHYVGQAMGEPIVLCATKRTTGVPCPGCRGTRAAFALGQGDLIAALTFNPLATAALLGVAGWAVMRFGFGRRLRINWGRRGRTAMAVGLTAAVLVNWAYVIYAGG